ncbi:type II secretion system inner membrane protein GspF [Jinshanibacter sp. LJY008]|uniref:General secretion pathway protein F n=1 Tax=Limnobaculum eriocheiris TaxID=2897391 RepID=A0A9X1MUX0_9GAMM|nr:type II secretion system inner membrane protein GspF [Limnobaculum eriocheiris]MCD1124963.1 type II secretion system inner membrane protein GspF [Limnobaculum eriocheiris]
MAHYAWRATLPNGKTQKGTLQADTPKQARQQLREQGMTPISIEETKAESGGKKSFFARKISSNSLALFTRQLSTLTNAALPLESALKVIARQTEDEVMAKAIDDIHDKVVEGYSLSDALGNYPQAFDNLYRTLVTAGEKTGHLGKVLDKLADYNDQRQQMKSKLTQAMVYPITLTLVATTVICILLVAVVPQVVDQFTHMKQQLPVTTRTLIAVSDFLQNNGLFILIGIVAAVFGFRTWVARGQNRLRYHKWLVRSASISKLVRAINSARYIRTLSILQASSVPLLEAMNISVDGIENLYAREVLTEAADKVRQGATLNSSLEQTQLFPPMMLYMVASGEQSSELGPLMERAADTQDKALQHRITLTLAVFEPALVITMATIVLFIVMSILQPILQLNNMVS